MLFKEKRGALPSRWKSAEPGVTRGSPCARPALLTQEPVLPFPAPTLSPPWRWHSPEVSGVGKHVPLHPARQKPQWLRREQFASFQGVTAYPGVKSAWKHRAGGSHCCLWKPGASPLCPSSCWRTGNCAAAGNSIKSQSISFILSWCLIHLYSGGYCFLSLVNIAAEQRPVSRAVLCK